jgi:hypothetical protein
MNEEPALESSLDLTLTQHLRDEDPEMWEVHIRLEVDPLRAWYYRISSNFHALVILLWINFIFGDEPKTICESCYKIEDTSIFTWFSILGIGTLVGCVVQFVDYFLIAREIT